MADLTKIVEDLSSLTVIEAADLSKLLEEKWGVSVTTPPVVAESEVSSSDGGTADEKTEFDVILTGIGEKKIDVIKTVRSITGLGLKESKSLVDGVPSPIKKGSSKEEADKIKVELEAVGATVEIK
jgi:large subunit ribosomal protein L7/L12